MSDLELAVRTVEQILPDMPTKQLEKWKGILTTALVKVEDEINSTKMHTCGVCGSEEYGYRTELPIAWREAGDLVICFNHEDSDIADKLKEALEQDEQAVEQSAEESLDELLAMV